MYSSPKSERFITTAELIQHWQQVGLSESGFLLKEAEKKTVLSEKNIKESLELCMNYRLD